MLQHSCLVSTICIQFNYTGEVMPFNNDCGEKMLQFATQLFLGNESMLVFTYPHDVLDIQVDLREAFVLLDDKMKQVFYSTANKAELERDIKKLNKTNIYFLCTGINNSAGHFQLLHFMNEQGWLIYSSETNHLPLTDVNEKVTEEAIPRIMTTDPGYWGHENGLRPFLLVTVNYDSIISAANYLYNLRVKGEAEALREAYHEDSKYILQEGIKMMNCLEPPVAATWMVDSIVPEPLPIVKDEKTGDHPVEWMQNPELTKALNNIRKELNLLKTHADRILQSNNKKSMAIMAVYNQVNAQFSALEVMINIGQYDIETQVHQLKDNLHELLHTHDPVLNKHSQAWKPFLVNILIACTGIGLIAIAFNAGVHITTSLIRKVGVDSNRLFFFSTTASQSCIDRLDKAVDAVPSQLTKAIPI